MSTTKKPFFILLLLLTASAAIAQKNSPKNDSKYINNDSTEIFSTHPSRPFKYGYALTKKQCEEDFMYLHKALNLQPGEKIAEVGAASGWIMGAVSVFTEGVTYYIQDIDSNYSNQSEMNKMVAHFSKVKGAPQTNTFHFVLGDYTSTRLPDHTFDKILVNNSFHEMTKPNEMIADMRKKLAPGGVIIINEVYANAYHKVKHGGCNIPARTIEKMNELFEKHGLYLVNTTSPLLSIENMLFYSSDKAAHEQFMQRVASVADYTQALAFLYETKPAVDSLTVVREMEKVNTYMTHIRTVFPDMESYFESVGDQFIKEKKFAQAAFTFQAYTIAFPSPFVAWDAWGDAFIRAKKYSQAVEVYSIAVSKFTNEPILYESRAYAYWEMDSLKLALKDLTKAIELGGENLYDYYCQRGVLYHEMDDNMYDEWMADFKKSIELNPKNGDAYFERGKIHAELENYEDAIADFTRIIEIDPENREAYFERAGARLGIEDLEGHDADMKKYKELKKKKK